MGWGQEKAIPDLLRQVADLPTARLLFLRVPHHGHPEGALSGGCSPPASLQGIDTTLTHIPGRHRIPLTADFSLACSLFYMYLFWLRWLPIAVWGLSLVVASGGCSLVGVHGLLIAVSIGSEVGAQSLWHMGLVSPWHVKSSWTRNQTRVPHIGRQILNHWTTRRTPGMFLR